MRTSVRSARCLGLGMAAALGLMAASAAADPPVRPLQIGVLPNLSARVILQHYQPMREYLERGLKRPVEIRTAPDFKTFYQRTQKGEYDLVVTAAHFARLAQIEAGYVPMVCYEPPISGLVIMAKDRPLRSIQDLRGGALAFANPQSLVALRGFQWLADQGLRRGNDFSVAQTRTEDSLGQMLLTGGATAAILSGGEFRQIPEEQRARLAVFTVFAEVPSLALLTHPRLPPAEAAALRAQMLTFPDAPEGKQFFSVSGFRGLREISPADLKALDPYLEETRRMLLGAK